MQNIIELVTQKQFLQTLVENNFLLPEDVDPFTFLKALLPNFASNFLRGLYFMLKWSKVPAIAEQKNDLLTEIDQALQRLDSLPAAWFANERNGTNAG